MENKVIYVNPYLLASIRLFILSIMLFSAYIRNEAFFLIMFISSCLLVFADIILERNSGMMKEQRGWFATIVDIIFFIALSLSYYFFFPPFISQAAVPYLILVLMWLFNRLFAFYKFRRFRILHHLSFKTAAVSACIFTLITMVTGNPYFILFSVLVLISLFAVVEEFLILRKMHRYDEEIDSLFLKKHPFG